MKNYILILAALVGLTFVSCSNDEGNVASEPTVSIMITTPDLQTRYGEGAEATELHWEVYVGDTHLVELDGSKSFNGQTTVDLRLVENKKYNLLFWAESPDQDIYTFADRKLTIDATKLKANEEAYDAFYVYEKDFVASSTETKTIELRRPFAQLNIATGDILNSSNAGVNVTATGVELEAYTELDLVTGDVDKKKTLTYDMAPTATGLVTVGQNTYKMISMNYLLVQEKILSDVKMMVLNEAETLVRNYSQVPFKRNHRTYIIGDLLTASVGFQIIILPGFDNDDYIFEHANN